MTTVVAKKSIYQRLEDYKLPALKESFKIEEGKEYDRKNRTRHCKTKMGLFYSGQISLIEDILNREI